MRASIWWLVQEPGGKGEVVRGSQGRKKTANLSVSQILGQESQRRALAANTDEKVFIY